MFLHDKTRQNQGERIEYAKFSSSIPPMAGGREPDVSRVSAKKKLRKVQQDFGNRRFYHHPVIQIIPDNQQLHHTYTPPKNAFTPI